RAGSAPGIAGRAVNNRPVATVASAMAVASQRTRNTMANKPTLSKMASSPPPGRRLSRPVASGFSMSASYTMTTPTAPSEMARARTAQNQKTRALWELAIQHLRPQKAQNFLGRGQAIAQFLQAVIQQYPHALIPGQGFNLQGTGAFGDRGTQLFVHGKDFMDSHPAFIAFVAFVTAFATVEGEFCIDELPAELLQHLDGSRRFFPAVVADAPHQALGNDGLQG